MTSDFWCTLARPTVLPPQDETDKIEASLMNAMARALNAMYAINIVFWSGKVMPVSDGCLSGRCLTMLLHYERFIIFHGAAGSASRDHYASAIKARVIRYTAVLSTYVRGFEMLRM